MKMEQVETEWGASGEGEGEREREQQISRVREGALDRNGNDMGQKWSLVKKDT
jgi:hypothetical protein